MSGKCMRKGWAWKPVNANLIEFGEEDPIGTLRCRLEATPSLFSLEEMEIASEIIGFVAEDSSPEVLNFCVYGKSDRKLNIETYNCLKKAIEASPFRNANRGLISSKKSGTQIRTIRCGAK